MAHPDEAGAVVEEEEAEDGVGATMTVSAQFGSQYLFAHLLPKIYVYMRCAQKLTIYRR